MRYITTLYILVITLLMSCSTPEKKLTKDEIVRNNIEEYLKTKLNDPKSYEFVELQLIDSSTFKDAFRHIKRSKKDIIESAKSDIERMEKYKSDKYLKSLYDADKESDLKSKLALNEKLLTGIDSIETLLKDRINEVNYYTYLFKFRSTNSFGAIVLDEYYLHVDPKQNFQLIELTSDPKRKILSYADYPKYSEFPGYIELLTKNGTTRGW